MKSLRITLPTTQRTCAVDAIELQAWSRTLLDEILLAAAREVSEVAPGSGARATVEFRIAIDPADGALLVAF